MQVSNLYAVYFNFEYRSIDCSLRSLQSAGTCRNYARKRHFKYETKIFESLDAFANQLKI